MNAEEFEKASKEVIDHCWGLLFSKSKEYANDNDRLKNFKMATSLFSTNQAKICLMYDTKHIASMVKIAEDVDKGILPTKELLMEKVGDYINYGLLYYANMLEILNKQGLVVTDIDGEEQHFTLAEVKGILDDQK